MKLVLFAVVEGMLPWWIVLGVVLFVVVGVLGAVASILPEPKLSTTNVLRLFERSRLLKRRKLGQTRPLPHAVESVVQSFFEGDARVRLVGDAAGPWPVLLDDAHTSMTVQLDREVG